MEKRLFPNIGQELSLLGFGLMRLPLVPGTKDIDKELSAKMVDQAIKGGVNYFDTAWNYLGEQSEPFAGEFLTRYPRSSYNLATKMPMWLVKTPDDPARLLEEQLKKCKTDHFDFYLLHCLTKDNYPLVTSAKVHSILRQKQKEGLIKHLGFSFHDSPDVLEKIVTEYDWDFAQIQLNYIDWDSLQASRQYEILASRKIPVSIMEPLRGGSLATLNPEASELLQKANPQVSVASWGIRYAASLPGVMIVLSGMSTPDQMADNIKTMQNFKPLSPEERATLNKAAELYRASNTIPCTGCRYCMDCPAGVDIPRVLEVYNQYCLKKTRFQFHLYYNYLQESEKAHNCVACGACMEHCPQHINIPEQMKRIAEFAAEKKPA